LVRIHSSFVVNNTDFMGKCRNCGKECNCYQEKNLKPPANIYLPFVAYGIFRPGDISFSFLKDYLDADPIHESIIGEIRIRDGVLIFSNKEVDSKKDKIEVYLLKFKDDQSETAYNSICQKEPENLYEWGEILIGEKLCNVLHSKDMNNGSNDFGGEAAFYYTIGNKYWKEVLKLVEKEINEISNFDKETNDLDQNYKVDLEYQYFLKIQQLYMLQWTEFERFAYFRYPQANSMHRGSSVFKDVNLNLSDYLHFKLKNDTIYNVKDLKVHKKLNDRGKLEFSYYNSLRNNIVHSGKTFLDDYPKLVRGLNEVHFIVKSLIEDTEKECNEIRRKYEQ
jgi:hypothetical protein